MLERRLVTSAEVSDTFSRNVRAGVERTVALMELGCRKSVGRSGQFVQPCIRRTICSALQDLLDVGVHLVQGPVGFHLLANASMCINNWIRCLSVRLDPLWDCLDGIIEVVSVLQTLHQDIIRSLQDNYFLWLAELLLADLGLL